VKPFIFNSVDFEFSLDLFKDTSVVGFKNSMHMYISRDAYLLRFKRVCGLIDQGMRYNPQN